MQVVHCMLQKLNPARNEISGGTILGIQEP
jgi:hypothetical protein